MLKKFLILFFVEILIGQYCHAAENFTMKGTLVEPPACVINNGVAMIIDFGPAISIRKVDGNNYKQKFKFNVINCGVMDQQLWKVYMTLTGNGVDYDSGAVKTNIDNLAMRITHDGTPFELGKLTYIATQGRVVLEAVPIKKPGAILEEGAFSAVATLQVDLL